MGKILQPKMTPVRKSYLTAMFSGAAQAIFAQNKAVNLYSDRPYSDRPYSTLSKSKVAKRKARNLQQKLARRANRSIK